MNALHGDDALRRFAYTHTEFQLAMASQDILNAAVVLNQARRQFNPDMVRDCAAKLRGIARDVETLAQAWEPLGDEHTEV